MESRLTGSGGKRGQLQKNVLGKRRAKQSSRCGERRGENPQKDEISEIRTIPSPKMSIPFLQKPPAARPTCGVRSQHPNNPHTNDQCKNKFKLLHGAYKKIVDAEKGTGEGTH
eukprot:gnl/Hemi2/24555_TR8255_c0_g1_i1.p2 gnl/Hemi2/24555_TR8255_c0_g1~~gnl/Hemi2/24555_TR8255_c0_g1_i1.p2  ORF type:complete len:113 (-),score=3.07 gnl/Hemi2/24555_TR8255_c0_g1_i1:139-477(-)